MAITASEARKHLFPLIEQVNDDYTFVKVGGLHAARLGRLPPLADRLSGIFSTGGGGSRSRAARTRGAAQ